MIKEYLTIAILLSALIYAWWRLFFKKDKKERLLFPEEWRSYLLTNVLYYTELSIDDRDLFEQRVLHFLKEIRIIGVDVELEEKDKLLVGVSGIIPIFRFPNWQYRNLSEVLLYKDKFNVDYQTEGDQRNILGMVGSGHMNRIMILSKPALHNGFENHESPNNVGIHEFVHLLDKSDGSTDGVPEVFLQNPYIIPWVKRMQLEINEMQENISDLNPYGATNEAEFFSVASEYFFKRPDLFENTHPELYRMMKKIYN